MPHRLNTDALLLPQNLSICQFEASLANTLKFKPNRDPITANVVKTLKYFCTDQQLIKPVILTF